MTLGFYGEAAAIGASLCWTVTALLFTRAGRVAKPAGMNMFRLSVAAVCLGSLVMLTEGRLVSPGVTSAQLWLLAFSAFLGLAFGDGFYFRSLTLIGPRRATLLAASSPVMTALLAVPLVGERLGVVTWGGILLATGGIVWVIAEQHENGMPVVNLRAGVMYGLIGAFGQATGLLTAKMAMQGTLGAVPTAFLRMTCAAVMVWIWALVVGRTDLVQPIVRDRATLRALILASLLGPVTGISLVLFAYRTTEAGVAATLSTLSPLFLIPVMWMRGEFTPTFRTVAGTVIALVGVAIIFMR